MIAYVIAMTFTPCPRPIDAPPIRLTIISTQTPGIECAKHAANPIDAAILTMAVGCALHRGQAIEPCENFSREPGTEGDE